VDSVGTLEALSRTFLDSALDCIITMDASGRVQEFNPTAPDRAVSHWLDRHQHEGRVENKFSTTNGVTNVR